MTIGNNNVGNVGQSTTQTTTNVENTPATVSNNATNNRQVTDVTNQSETQSQQVTSNDNRNAFQKMVDGFCEKFGEFWSKVETRFENSRLFAGMQGFGKGMADTGHAIETAAKATGETMQEKVAGAVGHESGAINACVRRDMRHIHDTQQLKVENLSAETSYHFLQQSAEHGNRMDASYMMKELANETDFAKLFSLHLKNEFSQENINFLDAIQKQFIVDVDQPLTRNSQNLAFEVDDLCNVHQSFISNSADIPINVSSRTRKKLSEDTHDYVSALKDLELATRAQTDENAQPLGGEEVPRKQQAVKSPTILNDDMAALKAVDVKLTEELEPDDPLFTEKQAVLDCKHHLNTSMRAAVNEIGKLLNDPNLRFQTQLKQNITGTRFDSNTATTIPQNNETTTVKGTTENQVSSDAIVNSDQITHTNTFSHSHLTLAHISKAADVIEPTNSLSVDDLSVPQSDDQLALSDESNGNVSNNPIGRTHTYGNTLTVPGMGEN